MEEKGIQSPSGVEMGKWHQMLREEKYVHCQDKHLQQLIS